MGWQRAAALAYDEELLMIIERMQVLQDLLRRTELDAATLSRSRDILYYTGTAQPSYLVVRPEKSCLSVHHSLEFTRRESYLPLGRVEQHQDLGAILRLMLPRGQAPSRSGIELDLLARGPGPGVASRRKTEPRRHFFRGA